MLTSLTILWNSFKMALQELRVNKLRTFLSLFGITIGIFCIISVLALVGSLEKKVQTDVKSLGNNTVYIDKWEYGGGPDNPWWKQMNRPKPQYSEVAAIKSRSELVGAVCYFHDQGGKATYTNKEIANISLYAATEDFNKIQEIKISRGRYLNESDFSRGVPAGVLGMEVATTLFGNADKAIGKQVSFNNHIINVVGVIEKQGSSLIGGFEYDKCIITPYRFFASIYDTRSNWSGGVIMAQAKDGVSSTALISDLRGAMRQVRRLSPKEEDDFALNDTNQFSDQISGFFGSVTLGGWVIAAFSLLVGGFGVANIMFVTVKERTSQIGLKKAIGARRSTILTEFLLESAFLCILGGFIGIFLVWLLSLILTAVLPFPIFISGQVVLLAFVLCVALGVISGFIPARSAAKLDPVVAIRTK